MPYDSQIVCPLFANFFWPRDRFLDIKLDIDVADDVSHSKLGHEDSPELDISAPDRLHA